MSNQERKKNRKTASASKSPPSGGAAKKPARDSKPARAAVAAPVTVAAAPPPVAVAKAQRSSLARSGVAVHALVLAGAAAFAGFMYTRETKPVSATKNDVVVWQGKADAVSRIAYESKGRKVELEAKQDKAGRYFVGTLEKDAKAKPKDPHGHPPEEEGEDGHDHGHEGEEHDDAPKPDAKAAKKDAPTERITTTLLSVGGAKKLAESLAPLKAKRALGRVDEARAADFGLAEPEGTVSVTIGGTTRKLVIGGATPGGGDRYVRDEGSGDVFAIDGDIVRDLESADTRLVERELHEWDATEVRKARLTSGDRRRELARAGEAPKRFWADSPKATESDETASNWMNALERLHPSEYPKDPPEGAEVVVRVDYEGEGGAIGFLELLKIKAQGDAKPAYFVLTERTRRPGKVPTSTAEQVETDLGSVLNK